MIIYKANLFFDWLVKNRIAFWIISSLLLFMIFFELRRSPSDEQGEPLAEGEASPVENLRWRVMRLNAELRVRNAEAYRTGGSTVLAVRAGRGARLPRLLRALAAVRGIDDALLVVSHSFYDPALNKLVRGVRFCRVLQVFYPHSTQLHPDKFPGPDPADCSEHNDLFCQPRDAVRVEDKLHWWWTVRFVFEYIREHGGVVLFLQEDDYVTPDLLYMLQYAQRAFTYHPEADLISLGGQVTNADYGLLKIDPWRPPFDRGLAFNRTVYDKIEAMADRYCAFEDDSWSYSLLNVFAGLPRGHAGMVSPAAARVRAGGGAGAARERAALFPARVRSVLTAHGRAEGRLRAPPRGNGGWGDVRDRLLCHDPFLATTTNSPPSTIVPNAP